MKKFFTLMLLTLAAGGAMAQGSPYREGVHYEVIPQAASFQPGDTGEVAEAFSYLCNHCNTFEPYIESWKDRLPEGVTFRRLPVDFGRASWGMYARAYITADVLGIADQSHPALMDAIWKNRRQMRSLDELAVFHCQFGVEKYRFLATANSLA
ncbi:MAG: thiol:disulfide interchange protein DsbA/DsbL, partial [Gammaproteobacteria bacterium]